jgi:hypothetical protein
MSRAFVLPNYVKFEVLGKTKAQTIKHGICNNFCYRMYTLKSNVIEVERTIETC